MTPADDIDPKVVMIPPREGGALEEGVTAEVPQGKDIWLSKKMQDLQKVKFTTLIAKNDTHY